jgi:hypothetical protein
MHMLHYTVMVHLFRQSLALLLCISLLWWPGVVLADEDAPQITGVEISEVTEDSVTITLADR